MTATVPREVIQKIRKLAQLPQETQQSRFAVSITRLTVLKSLCKEPEVAARFVTDLARRTFDRVERRKLHSTNRNKTTARTHREMMSAALAGMKAWQQGLTQELRRDLGSLQQQMRAEQNEHKKIPFGAVRIITDVNLLLFEYALHCLLDAPGEAGYWAYQTARHYAERYDPRCGTGLPPASAALVQDIADFWMQEYGLTSDSINATTEARKPQGAKPMAKSDKPQAPFTHRQGQFLAFIHLYRKLHRRGPAETDLVQFFRVTPPSAHGMVVKLEELGLVAREAGVPRSVRVAIPESEIPALEDAGGPPW